MTGKRVDTLEGYISAVQDAMKIIPPPDFLSSHAKKHWVDIMNTRTASAWTPSDLDLASKLARLKTECDELFETLERDGRFITSARGDLVESPVYRAYHKTISLIMSLSRMLHVHPEATQGPAVKQANKHAATATIRQSVREVQDDDLIPSITQ